jgi:hypothetical protein
MTTWRDRIRVYPAADIFPMMTDEALDDLAADIRVNGLLYPVMLDATGEVLIDGRKSPGCMRSRRRGASLRTLTRRHDPEAYIIATNVERRHLTAGQRASNCGSMRRFP